MKSSRLYGHLEHAYCEPVAEALAGTPSFGRFFLERAGQASWSDTFCCLKDEQRKMRSSGRFWWKNVFCSESRCVCPNLRGREVDILVVFERPDGGRMGLHIECKHPGDRFSAGQAARYRERLVCWTTPKRGPRTIPRHESAVAVLICDRVNVHSHDDLAKFDGVIFFDEIALHLPVYPLSAI